ncbi:MAG: hypothetical protein ABIY70_15455 [Capsulimonas sp.]
MALLSPCGAARLCTEHPGESDSGNGPRETLWFEGAQMERDTEK